MEKMFAKVAFLIEKILPCPHIELPKSQTFSFDGVKTKV